MMLPNPRRISRWLLLPGLAIGMSTLQAQQATTTPLATNSHAATPRLAAAALGSAVHLDGRLDDAAWAVAQPASLTAQRDPDEGQPPTERTEVRVLVGENALYIGARMFDSEPSRIVSRLGRRDDDLAGDRLTIRLDARHDHLTSFVFDVYPAGNKGDASVGSDGFGDSSWDPVWDVATSIDSLGWNAEIRIPLSQLRYDRTADDWGIQIVRFIHRKQEEDVLSFVPRSENEGANRYGHLSGLRNLPSARRVEIMPYSSARAEFQSLPPGNPFRDGSDFFGSAGADLKMGITSDLTLDLTINPDFGQVEVDPAVVNLSAFEVVFDEKRPFFVEGSDLFRFGQLNTFNSFGTPDVFFSRRIGRTPQGSVTDPNATYVDAPGQTTIAGAAKITGKTRNGWSFALLDAVTPEERGRFVTAASGSVKSEPVEPVTNYFVGRIRRELRQGNTAIGTLFTAVNRSMDAPALEGSLRSSAYLAGADLNHYWGNRTWALDASFATSILNGNEAAIARAQQSSARYYQRPDADNISFDSTRTDLLGYAAQIALTKTSGGHWGGNIAYQEKSPGYETNDIGFAQTVGRRGVSTDLHYQQTRPGPLFRNWIVGLLSGNDWNYDGDHTTSYIGTIVNFRLRNFWQVNTNYFAYFPSFDDQLTRGGPLAKLPMRNDVNASIRTDGRGAWSVGANGSLNWNGAGGFGREIGFDVSYQPSSNVRLSFGPSFGRFHNVSQFVAGVTDPLASATYGRRAVFATLDQRELALETRLDWTFSPRMSLQLYLQPLISAGEYTSYKEFARPGTFEFDVYGRDAGTITRDDATAEFTVDPDGAGPAAAFNFPDQNFNFRSLLANVVFRWEYRPGSTIFLVWQQSRSGAAGIGDFSFRRDFDAIFSNPAVNAFAVKMTYWLGA
jgi:hypothetical protein